MGDNEHVVGRAEELELVARTVARGVGVVVRGAAGVGKTALVREFLAGTRRTGAPTVWCAATEALASVPLGAVAHLLPVGAIPSGGVDPPEWAFDEIVREIGADHPLIAVVDDVHLLDPASAEVVARLIESPRAVVVATSRTGEELGSAIVAGLAVDGVLVIQLQPLARSESGQLVEGVLGGPVDRSAAQRLWHTTGGNPLFLQELTRAGRDRGELVCRDGVWTWSGRFVASPRVVDVVEERIAGLDDAERDLVELLALGEPMSSSAMADLCGAEVLDRGVATGIVKVSQDRRRTEVRLAHPLFAEVLGARLDSTRRRRLSGRLADSFGVGGGRRSGDLLRIATFQLEGGAEIDLDLQVRAARLAITLFDQPLAERLARAAAEAGAGPVAYVHLAEALYWQGRFDESLSVNAAVDLSEAAESVRAQAACCRASALLWGLDDAPGAVAVLEQAEKMLDEPGPRAEVAAHRSSVMQMTGDAPASLALAEEILADPTVGERAQARAVANAIVAQALCGAPDTAVTRAEGATELALRLSEELPTASGGIVIGQCLGLLLGGRAREMEELAQLLLDLSAQRRSDDFRGIWSFLRGRAALARGHVRSARNLCAESSAQLRRQDSGRILAWCLGVAAQAAGQLGDAADAATLSEEARAATGAFAVWDVEVALGSAWAASAAGEATRARDLALEAARQMEARGQYASEVIALHDAVRLGAAAKALPRLIALSSRVEGALVHLVTSRATAWIDGDGTALDLVVDGFEEQGMTLAAAEASGEAASLHEARGLRARAQEARRRAGALGSECEGAATLVPDSSALGVLTDREREVAALAARGLSRREVAERLYLSERTVGNHLHRAYGKLGVASADALRPFFGIEDVAPDS